MMRCASEPQPLNHAPMILRIHRRRHRLFLALGLSLLSSPTAATGLEAEKVIVLANANLPESVRIAEHYAAKRAIPAANIIELETSTEETISLRTYVESIHNPLLEVLIERDWVTAVKASGTDRSGRTRLSAAVHSVDCIVTIRGIPLRFENAAELIDEGSEAVPAQFNVNRAAVDSELSLIAVPGRTSMTAFVPNPYFAGGKGGQADRDSVIPVTRLDGPSSSAVINLIDRTLEAEQTGLMGRAYFDIGGPHAKGDTWMNAAGDLAQAAHFDTDFETTKRPMDARHRLDAPAIYMGWYRPKAYGPWAEPSWPVPPGAIAYHLHSFSATTVRSANRAWLGAFVRQGYCAMLGNVYEPYLELTHRPQIFLDALLQGAPFAVAALRSQPALSWMTVALGDPLYRPFAVELDTQLEVGTESPFAAYLFIRELNRLQAEGQAEEAVAFARRQFTEHPSLALGYALARLHSQQGEPAEAVEALGIIRYISRFSRDEWVLVREIADLLHRCGESPLALDLYKNLLAESGLSKALRLSLLERGADLATEAGNSRLASSWSMEAQRLKEPKPVKSKDE